MDSKTLVNRVEELNKKAQQINTATEGNRVRREITEKDIHNIISNLDLPEDKALDLNSPTFGEDLANLIAETSATIEKSADHLEAVINASEAGDTERIKQLTGIEVETQEIKVPSTDEINEKIAAVAFEQPGVPTQTTEQQSEPVKPEPEPVEPEPVEPEPAQEVKTEQTPEPVKQDEQEQPAAQTTQAVDFAALFASATATQQPDATVVQEQVDTSKQAETKSDELDIEAAIKNQSLSDINNEFSDAGLPNDNVSEWL